jgi:hypothetical protein
MGNKVGMGSRRCREAGCNRFALGSWGKCKTHLYEKVKAEEEVIV